MASAYEEYQICKVRGHRGSGKILIVCPPLSVCQHCGTHFRTESKLVESNVPNEDGTRGDPIPESAVPVPGTDFVKMKVGGQDS